MRRTKRWRRETLDHLAARTRRSLSEESSPVDPSPSCPPESEHAAARPGPLEAAGDWASLTAPLLLSVLARLDSLEDFFAFRGVCRGWRAVAAPSPDALFSQPPLLLLTRFPSYTEAFYDISRRRLYRAQLPWSHLTRFSLAYAHGFLVTTTLSSPRRAHLLLWNVLTGAKIRLPRTPEPFDRAIFSAAPARSPDCLAVLFRSGGCTLQFCHVGDSLWNVHSWDAPYLFSDIIFFGGKLYALTSSRRFVLVDLFPCPNITTLEAEDLLKALEIPIRPRLKLMLADCGGQLLLVCFDYFVFVLFQWDFGAGHWVETSSLGGRALFLGYRGFTASMVPNGLGVKENCIYYVGDRPGAWYEFSVEDRRLRSVFAESPGLLRNVGTVPPLWVLPNVC